MRYLIYAICLSAVCGGCSSTPKAKTLSTSKTSSWWNPFGKKDKEPEPYPNPVKMAATWSPDTLTQPGKTPTRGFGGRIFFYNEKSQPVPVEGELIVVAYEETGCPDQAPRARQFGFTKEQFTKHFSQSDLGASYSVWLPWDADGGMGQRITLVASFKPAEGNQIQGSPTVVMLPGPLPNQPGAIARGERSRGTVVPPNFQPSSVRQAGFAPQGFPNQGESLSESRIATGSFDGSATSPKSGVTTTTIPMGSDMTRRLKR